MQMAQFLSQLTRLVEEFGIAVLITNQIHVVASPGGMSFAKDATKSIGGYIIAHKSTTRLVWLRKGRWGTQTSTSSNQEREMAELAIPLHDKTKCVAAYSFPCKSNHAAATACHDHYSHCTDKSQVAFTLWISTSSNQEREMSNEYIPLHDKTKSAAAYSFPCKSNHAAATACHDHYSHCTDKSQVAFTLWISTSSNQEREMSNEYIPLHDKTKSAAAYSFPCKSNHAAATACYDHYSPIRQVPASFMQNRSIHLHATLSSTNLACPS